MSNITKVTHAASTSGTFWLVWNPNGQAPTHPHESEELAVKEAERLARVNRGQQFFVLQATHCRYADDMHRVEMVAAPALTDEPLF